MQKPSLSSFLSPQSVAVVGVSSKMEKLGSVILQNILDGGYAGNVYGVNPKMADQQLLGVDCYAELQDIPETVDMAIIVVPQRFVEDVISDAVKNKTRSVVIITAGFSEVGNTASEDRVVHLCDSSSIRLLGPNCLGAIFPHIGLNASFADGMPQAGNIAFISQSGAFCTAALDYAAGKSLGFSHFISLGNKADIDELDLLQAFSADDAVAVVALYLESVTDGRRWMDAIRQCKKPVIILEPGSSTAAQMASQSHTGSLAPSSKVLKAAYRTAGAIQVWNMQEMFTVLEFLTMNEKKRMGCNIGIITNAGGVGVLCADLVEDAGLLLPSVSENTKKALSEGLPVTAGLGNPFDIIGDAKADRYAYALEILSQTPEIDQILCILTPQKTTEIESTAKAIVSAHKNSNKSIIAAFIGGDSVLPGRAILQAGGVVCSPFPSVLLRAIGLIENTQKNKSARENNFQKNDAVSEIVAANVSKNRTSVVQSDVYKIAEMIGLPVPKSENHTEYEIALAFWKTIKKPAVLKISSPDALHKTELKGVRLNIETEEQFAAAWEALKLSIKSAQLDTASIQIQEQVSSGIELIIGFKRDPNFGSIMVFGTGGIYSEIWHDTSVSVLPVNDFEVSLSSTKIAQIISGTRGLKGVDMRDFIHILDTLQNTFLTQEGIQAIDLNPVIAHEKGVSIVDIKLILKDS